MFATIKKLYDSRCPVCGGLKLPPLSDTGKGPFDDIINAMAERLFNEKVSKGTIDQALYDQTAKELLKAMHEGLGGVSFSWEDPRNSLKAYLEHNLYSFSAAKSLTEYEHIRSLLYDGDRKRSFEEFRNACLDAGYQFNVNWLRTEYNTTHAATQAAAQWQSFIDNGTEVLEYTTVGDDKVRPAHQALDRFTALITDPIWNLIFPPNDWNCRCWVIPGNKGAVGTMQVDMNLVKDGIPYQFQKNVGTTKVIYDNDHPYYQAGASNPKELQAVKNYGMWPVDKLYEDFKWPAKIEFATKEEANAWWADAAKGGNYYVKDVNGVVVKFDDAFKIHATEENKDNRWRFIGNIAEIIANPDEVWSLRKKDVLQRYYLKYFDGSPLAVWVDAEGEVSAYTFVEMQHNGQINMAGVNNLRRGVLLYRKNLKPYPIP